MLPLEALLYIEQSMNEHGKPLPVSTPPLIERLAKQTVRFLTRSRNTNTTTGTTNTTGTTTNTTDGQTQEANQRQVVSSCVTAKEALHGSVGHE